MRDADGDGYGDMNAPNGGVAGTDCDDTASAITGEDIDGDGYRACDNDCDIEDPNTHPGAAESESTDDCMRDADGDGYGDDTVEGDIVPGTDCEDDNPDAGPFDNDGDGFSACEGDCDDTDPENTGQDLDGDGYSLCDGDAQDDNPAIAYVAANGATFSSITSEEFSMGSPTLEVGRDGDEVLHQVYLTKDFLIMNHEVSQGQFEELMGYNPSDFQQGAEYPVESVSWHEAAMFANRLSAEEDFQLCYSCTGTEAMTRCEEVLAPYNCSGFRLPTEAEWEYSVRAGSSSAIWTNNGGGDLLSSTDGNICEEIELSDGSALEDLAWYCGNTFPEPHLPAIKMPNSFYLFDMYGNVSEWVHDAYDSYDTELVYDPYTSAGDARVIRGGSFNSRPSDLRSANRRSLDPLARQKQIGFRLARTSPFE
ncbi:MAG: formylglycine-generating enzyme family protein [Myxococcota bacterium]|nr:formylglycine-generating enzyme family protein [Myxococcota bacterium]